MPRAKSDRAARADTTGKKRRAKKDPNAPKRALAAYMFFSKDVRERVKQENPDASFGEIGRILGDMWNKMPAEKRQPYDALAEADKKRYEQEKASYRANLAQSSEEE
ncbi:Non-histone chromosomal protein 6 [Dispira simplex]|nr:Non-histone chromosomal protein 6 [Dispira simplex]KAJ1654240.1 Non-histone chromosomal protein 6 [Dispira simplex]